MCGAIGVVLYTLNLGSNAVLGALKINLTIVLLMSTTNVPGSDAASIISATSLGFFSRSGA